jgi:hypothetical protein
MSTNKPVKMMLKAMQLANAMMAGLKSDVTTAVCVACRALWITKTIIARYETIMASANRNRRAPDLSAVTDRGATSVALCKLAPSIFSSASRISRSSQFTLGSGWHRHQTLFRDSYIFSGDWRT